MIPLYNTRGKRGTVWMQENVVSLSKNVFCGRPKLKIVFC